MCVAPRSIARLVLWLICLVPSLSAVIVEVREYHGKTITCLHGGLIGFAKACGTRGYARVFTGTVISATDISDSDKRLELIPDESFFGNGGGLVSVVLVNQACMASGLPEIKPGDKWLFYLQQGKSRDEFALPYDSPSKPLLQAQEDIELLHRLSRLTDWGVVVGKITPLVRNGERWDAVPVANRNVVVIRKSDNAEFAVLSDQTGHFQLELAPDSYHITANLERSMEPKLLPPFYEGDVFLSSGECVEVELGVVSDKAASLESNHDQILIPPLELPDRNLKKP